MVIQSAMVGGKNMKNTLMIKAGVKRHKGSFLGIIILLFLVSLSISTVLTIYLEGGCYIHKEIQRVGFGNLTAWVSGVSDMKTLTESIQMQDGIESTSVQNVIFSGYEAHDLESDSEGQLISWTAEKERYRFFRNDLSGYIKYPQEMDSGTIYVSPSMVSIMNLKIGDTITFPVARDGKTMDFTVVGYYEDPFMGSSMIGMKGFLISEEDYNTILSIIEQTGINSLVRSGAMIHIFTDSKNTVNASNINRSLNQNTTISQYIEFIHSEDAIEEFMVILQNAFCGILAAFAFVLLIVTLAVLGHSISGIIEQEYKNLGIFKTIGFTGKQLIFLQLIPYVASILIGMLLGIVITFPLASMVSKMILTTTGVLIPIHLPVFPCLVVFAFMLLLLIGFIFFKLRKIISISPIRAIRTGMKKNKCRSGNWFQIKIEFFTLQLAIRQLLSGRKRYMSACLIAVLLVFFASLTGRINAWLGLEGKGMMDAFNPADLDIGVQVFGELNLEEMEHMLQSYTDITDSYLLAMPSVSVNGTNYSANVITDPERFHISQGKTSIKKDEIVLTEIAASDLGVTVGDKVTISGDIRSSEFTVSGIYHCVNNMGANLGMSIEGYLTIGQNNPQLWCHHYFLADTSKKEIITQALETAYGGDVHIHENSWPGLFGIITAMRVLLVFMYGMIAIFIFIVTIMTGSKILAAEQKDFGIYKSIGCSTQILRLTFSFRFGIVSLIGSFIGTILAAFLTDPIVSSVMRFVGISNFTSHPTVLNCLTPGIAVILLFLGFSYLVAGRIRRVDMTVLIAD